MQITLVNSTDLTGIHLQVARVGWTERSEVQQPVGINVGLRFAQSNLHWLHWLLGQ
jgi:hypothetical protein